MQIFNEDKSGSKKKSPELWNVQCMAVPIAVVMSFWNLELKSYDKQAEGLPLLKTVIMGKDNCSSPGHFKKSVDATEVGC